MGLQSWFLFFHILGAIVWIGAGATISVVGLRVRRSSDRAVVTEFSRTLGHLGLRAFMPSLVVVLATGLLMVLDGSQWRLSQPWILIGLALFVLAFLIGALYVGRIGIALERAVAEPGRDMSAATALIGRWLVGYALILLVLVAAVWDMVFKPIVR